MGFISNLFGGGSSGANTAATLAQTGAQAANTALQAQEWNQLQANIKPFVQTGQTANQQLMSEIQGGGLGQPFNLTQQQLAQTPGYQWALQQGLQSTQNAAAARGLGVSGAALKGAANFATGLADQTYQNQFQDYWANQNNRYNMLAGLSSQGANAAVGAASGLNQAAAQTGQGVSNIGNALTQGLQTASGLNMLQGLTGGTAGLSGLSSGASSLGNFAGFAGTASGLSSAASAAAPAALSSGGIDLASSAAPMVLDALTFAA